VSEGIYARGVTAGSASAVASASSQVDLARVGPHLQGQNARFGLWLPGVSAGQGFSMVVKIIHERDQFLQQVQPLAFPMGHVDTDPYGDFWSTTVDLAAAPAPAGSHWGQEGRYVYRFCLRHPDRPEIDWIIDPFAREFGVGKLSAFTLGYQNYQWSDAETAWRTPALRDLVLYELNLAEFGGDLERSEDLLDYLADLGVNAIQVMPVSNIANEVDWGYMPLGFFGVDERFGKRSDFQRFVDGAHRRGLAVIVDAVYAHTAGDFPYAYVYRQLGYAQNPMMGPFAGDAFGESTDWKRPFTRDFFAAVNQHWLTVYHVDGFRYDYVPGFWDGATGDGYARLVHDTYQTVREAVASAAADSPWRRFGSAGDLRLCQVAEQLEAPEQVLNETYSNATWQNRTYDAAKKVASGDRGRLADLGLRLGAQGFPEVRTVNDVTIEKTPLQYIENHDHERFICNFGLVTRDDNVLLAEGDRSRWFKLQPYLIALLASKGTPMLWQGQELGENYFLPENGIGRVILLRPVRWDYFYDPAGKRLVRLVRDLLRVRNQRSHLRRGQFFFFNDWDRYQSKGLLLFARYEGDAYTLVAVNTSDTDQTVPFWFPIAGHYREELHGGELDLHDVVAWQHPTWITVPGNYGRIWTAGV
jgi:maltooligosyltrehalose trehalohydrolase